MRWRTSIGILLFALASLAAAAPGPETSDAELAAAIRLYRTEGAAAALPDFERLRDGFNASGDRPNEAVAQRYIGESHWRAGQFDKSRQSLERALSLVRELGERHGEGRVLNVLGLLEWDLGHYDAALAAMGQANVIAAEIGDARLTASTLNNMGLVHDELGDYPASLDEYERSYQVFLAAGDLRGQGDALGNTGGVHLLLGRFAEALGYYERALAISEELASKPAMTIDHGNLALCYLGLGRFETALVHFDRALDLAAETGMQQEQAYWQRGKANALIRQGKYDLGLENHRAALAAYEESGARGLLLDALHDMGSLHLTLGDPVSADGYFQRALRLAREIGHAQGVTANLVALGDLQYRQEQWEEARALYLQALQRASEAGELNYRTEALLRLAAIETSLERFDRAGRHASTALDITRETGAVAVEAEAWFALGESARGEGNAAAAFAAYASAQAAAGRAGDPDLAWRVHYGRARTHVLAGDRESAVVELQSAARIIEGVRDRLQEDRFRAGYIQDKHQVYIDLVRLQLELGRTQDAFSSAERLRARSFLAQLDQGGPVARTETERRAEMTFRERIRQLQELLAGEQQAPAARRRQLAADIFSNELLLAEREYQAFLDDLDGGQAELRTMSLPGVDEVQDRLGPGEALIEYVVAEDAVHIFVVRPEHIAAASSRQQQNNLRARIGLLRAMLQQPGNERWLKPAAALAALLIEPARETGLLDGVSHLHLVPHGILNYLPFAVLPLQGGAKPVMMESFTLSYLPAAAALVRSGPNGPGQSSLLALAPGKARLKHAPEEARTISALFQPRARLLEGGEATETAFKASAADFAVLHLATHGYFNRKNPLLSGLELEPDDRNDGLLEVHEILGLELGARLVTLSACQTGLGSGWFDEIPAGDEFVGLTRAFLFAGSRAVLASLWEVDDRSTVDLMRGFYQRIGDPSAPRGQAAALALVQRELRLSNEFSHPFYWAPFVLVGQHAHPTAQS